jgi:hypothetical protein
MLKMLIAGVSAGGLVLKELLTKAENTLREKAKLALTLKVALLNSNAFQTVVHEIKPETPVSFGRVPRSVP